MALMFDITPDEIAQLDDVDLRTLVGRLCEAELANLGLSASAVTYGGDQRAADGGLDVRVTLPAGTILDGFIPRPSTGFQVKAEDMPRRKIAAEMRPNGLLRPVIGDLAGEGGAYIIVSSKGSVADLPLRERRDAMRNALRGLDSPDRLLVEFYDRNRLASWVRRHPGLVTWVKEKVGRALTGWRPYGPWATAAESVEAEYLVDDKLRLHIGPPGRSGDRPLIESIDALRDVLARPRAAVRLIGLSGVGKTRLVQALFDSRIGSRPLPPSQAVYANLADDPDPQPVGLVSDLIASGLRAIVIVDNSPAELHGRLAERCSGADSKVSFLTVEYDVREDQPANTEVARLVEPVRAWLGSSGAVRAWADLSEGGSLDVRDVDADPASVHRVVAYAGKLLVDAAGAGVATQGLCRTYPDRLSRKASEADQRPPQSHEAVRVRRDVDRPSRCRHGRRHVAPPLTVVWLRSRRAV
jgi:hypothetical protein